MIKKIVWLTSYPKSGNTWLRYLISNYFYNTEKSFDFNIIRKIDKFPSEKYFNDITPLEKKEILKDPKKISKHWIPSQINFQKKINDFVFFKTHNPLIVLDNNYFTSEDVSLAIIHIVRDPRDVALSYSNFTNKSIDETINFLITKKLFIRHTSDKHSLDFDMLGSWSLHYSSWCNGLIKIPRILIRYEDLLENPFLEFLKLIKFLSEILNIQVNENQINFSLESSNFKSLSKNEKMSGFSENNAQNNKNFFNIGKKNQWESKLSYSQIKKIEKNFLIEMRQLGYL